MKIEEISIFGEYKQPENRVTAAFLQICKVGGEGLIRFLANELNIPLPSSEIEIISQAKGDESIPDGLLRSNFSFNLYIESKIAPNAINKKQLIAHQSKVRKDSSTDFLIYLTPDETKPSILGETYWTNWISINNKLNEYLQNPKIENKQILEFLIIQFETLLSNSKLLNNKNKWTLDNEDVIIVAGSWAEGIALKYNYYICQNNRSFRPASYLAFVNNNQIRHVFKIASVPENDVNLRERPEFSSYISEAEPNYPEGDRRKVFPLERVVENGTELILSITNDVTDKNGNPCPFTYGQPRYTKLSTLKSSTRTSQL